MRIAEHGATWRKSTYSDNDQTCVEVAVGATEVGVRDTKDREGGQLAVTGPAWTAFIDTITAE